MLFLLLVMVKLLEQNSAVKGALYEVTIDSFEPVSNYDKTAILLGTIRLTRMSRNNFVVTGDVEYLKNFGNEYTVRNSLDRLIYAKSEPFCDLFNSPYVFMKRFREASGVPPGNYCPLPKNRYVVDNFRIQDTDLPLVALKDTYTISVEATAVADGHRVIAFKFRVTIK
ncbi:uncharacterized protein LOC128739285 [Sabethes cyaneus]|uniref:uncharacterized protein LOC128739285 n=1 Tax=Sabethes cyaneus TaxID=53552 RepID=UPI00237EE8E8|nr:uncharacterized protein LOC128739285 [Sabethes cyaneus]